MTRRSSIATALFVVGSLCFLHHVGAGDLAAPPLGEPRDIDDWLEQRDPITATFALLRLVGIGAGWYLVAATTLQVLSTLTHARGLGAVADVLSTPAVRHVASGLIGLTLSLGANSGDDEALPGAPTLERLADPSGSAVLRRLPDNEVIVRIPDEDEGTAVMTRMPAGAGTEAVPDASWIVECGDHPWSIAKDTLADEWGRSPTDAEVDPYWRELITLNALPNPDLVFPGQMLHLPPVPPAP